MAMLMNSTQASSLPAVEAASVKTRFSIAAGLALCGTLMIHFQAGDARACSTFKLQKANELL
jgi:hypothetical protein